MKSLKEAIANTDTEMLMDKVNKALADAKIYPDIWPTGKDSFAVFISWGDWKHDHLYADKIIEDTLGNIDFSIEKEVTEEDGSDTFSAIHNVTIYPSKASTYAHRDRSKKESFYDDFFRDDESEYEDEEDQYYDWYEDYEFHPLVGAYDTACDELNVWAEGSTQGPTGIVLFYDNETNETKYRVYFEDEIEFMNSLDPRDDERSNINAIKSFISSHNDINGYEDEDDEADIDDLDEKVLKESVVTLYNGTNDTNLDYKNIDFTKSKELGVHCGSEKAASLRGSIINKLSIDTSNCYKMDVDFSDMWSKPTLLQYMNFLTPQEITDARGKMREVSGDRDKYEKYSTILRDLFLKHGYKCISYPNGVEDPGHTSYIILDNSIVIDESVKEDLEYDYDDAKNWEGIFDIADEQETANAFQQPVKGKGRTYLPKLSVEEVRELAEQHYNEGGDAVVECWTDEDILMWIEEHGTKEELLQLFRDLHDRYADMKGSGEYCDLEANTKKIEDEDNIEAYYDEEDFGPGNPWDAPGMSIKDFLR